MLTVAEIQGEKRQNKTNPPPPLKKSKPKKNYHETKNPAVENFRRNKSKDLERKEISNSLDNWQGAKEFLFRNHLCFLCLWISSCSPGRLLTRRGSQHSPGICSARIMYPVFMYRYTQLPQKWQNEFVTVAMTCLTICFSN